MPGSVSRFLLGSDDRLPQHQDEKLDLPSKESLFLIFVELLRHYLAPTAFSPQHWWQSHPTECSAKCMIQEPSNLLVNTTSFE